MNAAQQGEAAGRWFGPGAAHLGLAGEVEHGDYLVLYGERPADPRTGEPLGRAKSSYQRQYEQTLAGLLAAEPHATADRAAELQRQARAMTRQSPAYTDVTAEHAKSVSILHGSIRENARRARDAGDLAGAAWWDAREARFSEILQEANRVALEHLQEWAGITRTGYHGRKVHGGELGRWEPAELIVSSWLQGTSRAGEMHDHIHNAIHPKVRTVADGKWRAADTMAIRRQLPALAAIESAYAEAALSAEFGVEWVPRPDGIGNEIKGISQAEIDAYSSRRDQVTAKRAELAGQFRDEYGRDPNQRELRVLHEQAWALGRPAKEDQRIMAGDGKDARIDWDKAAALWDEQLGGKLREIAGRVASRLRNPGSPQDFRSGSPQAESADLARYARQALAAVQARHPTWTRADLMRQIGIAVPAELKSTDPAAAVAMVHQLTDRALAGEFEQVESADSPDAVPIPGHLRREIDGRSVYTRPGSDRYCTLVQLSLEERLLAHAETRSAPCLDTDRAAQLLGADAAELDAVLHSRAAAGRSGAAGSGLRMDQAAALYRILTSPRTAEVLVGPAGSGKTRTLAEAAKVWKDAAGGRGTVMGLATAQAARNVLAAAGVELAENSSVFLGHLPGKRGARGITKIPAGSLLVIDEASMMSAQDLHDILAYARLRGCKVIIAGDQEQLAAVEGGGAMMLLARRLGYVQLAEAVRFEQQWERDASLGLRRGELAALDVYDDHARLIGNEPDLALDQARAAYLGHYLAGQNVLMVAASHKTCFELSRRVREDLVHLGLVDDTRTLAIDGGARCGRGDLIVCGRNDHEVITDVGHELANGDLLRVEAVNADGSLTCRRQVPTDSKGPQRWADQVFTFTGAAEADLAYAVTGHVAQGRTVDAGVAVVTGTEGRQWLYSAMTRGAKLNRAFVFARWPKIANLSQGTDRAPELARHERIEAERNAEYFDPELPKSDVELRDARSVIADVLGRDDSQDSALETRDTALADADHLAVLDVMWQGETRRLRVDRYKAAVRDMLPPEFATADLDSGHATWLWRSLRHAEESGLDAREVVRRAAASRSFAGSRDVLAVLDDRIRAMTGGIAPQSWRPWSRRIPETNDPVASRFLTRLAAAMDARKKRLGEHTAETAPAWAVNGLGPVPEDPAGRADWAELASHVAAYRELAGFEHDTEPVGAEPVNSPELRAAWFAAYSAITHADEAELDGKDDGSLWLMRATYERETAWAPQYAGNELRLAHGALLDAHAQAALSQAHADAARRQGDHDLAARHDHVAAGAASNARLLQQLVDADTKLMADRQEWSNRTAGSRLLACQADAELRRRHPDMVIGPLRSAEPDPAPERLPDLTPEVIAAHVAGIEAQRAEFAARLEDRMGVLVPSEDPDALPEGEAWPAWQPAERDAILQPPKPRIPAREPEREPEHVDPEAA